MAEPIENPISYEVRSVIYFLQVNGELPTELQKEIVSP